VNGTFVAARTTRVNKNFLQCRVANKVGKACANKTGMVLEHWAMEQGDGFGFGIGRLAEVVNVSIWAEAADDGGAGWGVNGLA